MRSKSSVTVDNLRDGQAYGMLLCRKCGGEYSADRGDYFWMPSGKVFKCCGINNILVRKVTQYAPVEATGTVGLSGHVVIPRVYRRTAK